MKLSEPLYQLGFREYELIFKQPAWTSRGSLTRRKVLFLLLKTDKAYPFTEDDTLSPHPTHKEIYAKQLSWMLRTQVPPQVSFKGGGWTVGPTFNQEISHLIENLAKTPSPIQQVFIGEAAPLVGLSYEYTAGSTEDFFNKMEWMTEQTTRPPLEMLAALTEYPSLAIAFEMALRTWKNFTISNTTASQTAKEFTKAVPSTPLPINGLIWMGDFQFLQTQVDAFLKNGFRCLKMKVGVNLAIETKLLAYIRSQDKNIAIRLDFNGSLPGPLEALKVLEQLAPYNIHSVEQPLPPSTAPSRRKMLLELISRTPITIALDEELIGLFSLAQKKELLEPLISAASSEGGIEQRVKKIALVLKPTLIGGFKGAEQWMTLARHYQIAWWVTSALESALGLEQIYTWLYLYLEQLKDKQPTLPQGLGTGELFVENLPSSLSLWKDHLKWKP